MDYVEISNSMIVYLLCGITVAIAFVQAVLYIRMAKKMTVKANIPATVPKTAFRVGLISAIGPALGVFIVMVGLMTSIGGPMAWQRLSIIGAAPTELTAATLGAEAAGAELGGKRSEITVMFADIRGFTSLSESHKAEEVSQLLNEYFTELEPIITKYNGVINKFIGDAVLVVFGDPTQDKLHAVKCAYELRKKVKQIKQRWLEEGKPKIDIGIGINTGEAFIGNVGTKNRFEYTVIGDTVNIASRIEDYNKIYKTHILISENTYNKISQIVDVIKIREVSIKGKSKKINIYEVLRITE